MLAHFPCRYVAWVTAAFGPFWGFQEGWWSWLSGVTDNSVYPVLFLTYLDAVVPGEALCCSKSGFAETCPRQGH